MTHRYNYMCSKQTTMKEKERMEIEMGINVQAATIINMLWIRLRGSHSEN